MGAVGGFSPGLEEAGTPLNNTFLSTLAEAPQATAANTSNPTTSADFPPGRSAPAQTLVPATIPKGASRTRHSPESGVNDETSGRRKRSSDGGEDVDTAEEEAGGPATGSSFASGAGNGHTKGKAKVEHKSSPSRGDVFYDAPMTGDGSIKLPTDPNTRLPSSSSSRYQIAWTKP